MKELNISRKQIAFVVLKIEEEKTNEHFGILKAQ